NRRQAPVGLNLLVDRTEVAVEDAANIGGALEADPVGDPGARDGRAETIAVGDGPGGEAAATASATDDELVRGGDSLFDQVVHSAVDVLPVGLAVAADDAAEERGAAAGGAARVGQEDRVAPLGEELPPVVPAGIQVVEPGTARPAVDVDQQGIALPLLIADGEDHHPLDLQPVGRGPADIPHLTPLVVASPGVEVGQPARL